VNAPFVPETLVVTQPAGRSVWPAG
jgi:hypothetical protein